MKSRLNIDGQDVGFMQELQISTNYQIADVREPSKRTGANTKTIVIPGDAVIKKIFEGIFDINAELTNFNPNLKTPAKYYVNEVLVFDGDLQLLRINNKFVNDYESTQFECSLVGVNANLFLDIAGLYLTDIDLSDLDHSFQYSSGLFVPALGTGYCYAYQDYGVETNGARLTDEWNFKYLKPLVFEREYVLRIFEDAGYTWNTGGYFDSDYEKRIVIPDVNQGRLRLDAADVADNECYVGRNGTFTGSVKVGSVPLGSNYFIFYTGAEVIESNVPYNDEAAPFFDPNGRWDAVTDFDFTANQQGVYYLHGSVSLTYNIVTYPTGAVTWSGGTDSLQFALDIFISSNGGGSWSNFGSVPGTMSAEDLPVATPGTLTFAVTNQNILVGSGDLVRISLRQNFLNDVYFYDAGNNPVTTGGASIRVDIEEPSVFRAKMAFQDLDEGQTVRMNTTIPQNVTQLDFLTSIIKIENLYFEPNPSISNQYVIETREDFYETNPANALDWTDKWDVSKTQEIIPMGEVDFNKLRFTYKSDQDHYNKKYFDKYKDVYGTELRDTENDFVKNEKKIEVVFSNTPIAGTPANNIVAPRYFNMDEATGIVKPLKCNIRRLYWGGLIDCDNHNFIYGGVDHYVTQYPFVGHVDNPTEPTVDLCFDNPLELYWFYPGVQYTDNNRYNERYSKYISEITDQNSKIVRQYFNLTENDINQFSFSDLVFVRDTYYYVNKIEDYNPQVKSVTKVELLKLKAGSVFVPSVINLDDIGGDDDIDIYARQTNTNIGTGQIIGVGNFNGGIGSVIIGDNNVIG